MLVFREVDLKRGFAALVATIVLVSVGRVSNDRFSTLGSWLAYVAVLLVALAFHHAYQQAFAEHPHERVVAYLTDAQIVQLAVATGVYVACYEALRSEADLWWGLLSNGAMNAAVLAIVVVAVLHGRARRPRLPR